MPVIESGLTLQGFRGRGLLLPRKYSICRKLLVAAIVLRN